jgi:hypothetical protein
MAPRHSHFHDLQYLQFVVSEFRLRVKSAKKGMTVDYAAPCQKILNLEGDASGQHMILALEQRTAVVSESAQPGSRWPQQERKWTEAETLVPIRDGHNWCWVDIAGLCSELACLLTSQSSHTLLEVTLIANRLVLVHPNSIPRKHSSTHSLAVSCPYHTATCSSTPARFSDFWSEMVSSDPGSLASVLIDPACSVICRDLKC